MAPETHTRYRVQRLIRLGEWLEQHQDTLILAIDCIDRAHDNLIEPAEDVSSSDIVEQASFEMLAPVKVLNNIRCELAHGLPVRDVKMGKDVTIYQRYASTENRYEVVMPAPVPKLEQDS